MTYIKTVYFSNEDIVKEYRFVLNSTRMFVTEDMLDGMAIHTDEVYAASRMLCKKIVDIEVKDLTPELICQWLNWTLDKNVPVKANIDRIKKELEIKGK